MSAEAQFVCQYCEKSFSSKGCLTTHTNTARSCLKRRGVEVPDDFKCILCEKAFFSQITLNNHARICMAKSNTSRLFEIQRKLEATEEKLLEYDEKMYQMRFRYEHEIEKRDQRILELEAKIDQLNGKFQEIATQPRSALVQDHNEDEIPSTLAERIDDVLNTSSIPQLCLSTITLNNIQVNSRRVDHYVNATELCQAGEKRFKEWTHLDSTKELFTLLSNETGIPVSLLVESKRGQSSEYQEGTWIHPELAIQLAQWISPTFCIQISQWIHSLFKQSTIEVDLKLFKLSQQRLEKLENVCLARKRRFEYPEKNTVYMITTDHHLKRRTYIVGKARDLTARLGIYNKTCDHRVVHYRECPSEKDMSIAEVMILSKLRDYREQSNRDRFVLPLDQEESFFKTIIDECVDFIASK